MGRLGVTLTLLMLALGQEARSQTGPTSQDVRTAVGRSLPFLERGGVAWKDTKGCTSCHHVPMMLWTHHEARSHGFPINGESVEEAEEWALDQYFGHPEFKPTVQDRSIPRRGPGPGSVYLALGVGAAEKKGQAAESLKKLSAHFRSMQEPDGSWAMKQSTALLVDGDDVATLFILLAMDPKDGSGPAAEAREKALGWLAKAPCRDETQALALRTMVAARYGDGEVARKTAARLRVGQRENGGWAQVEGRPSDALATGQALCALVAAGEATDGPAIRRAWAFLLGSQRDDGSWAVKPRTPKGHDEIVSYYGTGWATLGLLRSLPRR